MERLSDHALEAIVDWSRKAGLVMFIAPDRTLKIYPATNPKWKTLQAILFRRHPEMKMFLIRTMKRGEE